MIVVLPVDSAVLNHSEYRTRYYVIGAKMLRRHRRRHDVDGCQGGVREDPWWRSRMASALMPYLPVLERVRTFLFAESFCG